MRFSLFPRRLTWRLAARACACALPLTLLPPLLHAAEYVGIVHPNHELNLAMGTGGVIASVRVLPGQHVRANDVLMVLDDRLQALEVERRKAIYDDKSELRATQERVRALNQMLADNRRVFEKTGSISRDELLKLEIETSAAVARVQQLEAQEERERLEHAGAVLERQLRQLPAPVEGVITKVDAKVGEWAKPGDALLTLVDVLSCYLKVNVPVRAVAGLRPGARLPIRVEGASAPVTGTVSFLSSVADPASGLVEMRLTFPNPAGLRPGVKGSIVLGS